MGEVSDEHGESAVEAMDLHSLTQLVQQLAAQVRAVVTCSATLKWTKAV
jgi:hypothetical protein